MAAQNNNKNKKNNSGSNSALDNIISFVFLIAIIAAFGFFLIKNEIDSVEDLKIYFDEKSDIISTCFEEEETISCLNEKLFPGKVNSTNGNNENNNQTINAPEKLATLETIPLSEPNNVEYDRSEYKHWSTINESCNTREIILKEQGTNVLVDEDCQPTAGEWIDPYTNETISDPSTSDIDHVIPLGYANAHGANTWTPEIKEQFANDTTQLLAVSASENRSKSDKGPSEYMPPNKDFQCQYSSIWVDTAYKYQLSITVNDRDVLKEALEKCL